MTSVKEAMYAEIRLADPSCVESGQSLPVRKDALDRPRRAAGGTNFWRVLIVISVILWWW